MNTTKRLLVGAFSFLGVAVARLASATPSREAGLGLPRDASKHGHNIDWLLHSTLLFVTILFIIMCIWMYLACTRHNEKHTAEYDHGNSKHSIMVALALSAAIFFIVDGNLWVKSTLDVNRFFWNHAYAEKQDGAVRIQVNAHQWAWDFRYLGQDKCKKDKTDTGSHEVCADDIYVMNEMVVPVDTPILLQLASVDVIHSFYLPHMRVKIDAVPGSITRLWFHPKQTGEFDIGCAQHCGVNHYKMKGILRVVTKEEYAEWLARARDAAKKQYVERDQDFHWGWPWAEH